jgi:hypothetical protein
MVVLSWGHVRLNLQPLPAKIASLQPLPQRWLPYAMPQVNLRSYIAAKEIFASVLLLPNVFQVYVTQFL